MDHLGTWHRELATKFLTKMNNLPSGPWSVEIDAKLKVYVWGIGNWLTANIEWGFESERYFGSHGLEIREHRLVTLLPPRHAK